MQMSEWKRAKKGVKYRLSQGLQSSLNFPAIFSGLDQPVLVAGRKQNKSTHARFAHKMAWMSSFWSPASPLFPLSTSHHACICVASPLSKRGRPSSAVCLQTKPISCLFTNTVSQLNVYKQEKTCSSNDLDLNRHWKNVNNFCFCYFCLKFPEFLGVPIQNKNRWASVEKKFAAIQKLCPPSYELWNIAKSKCPNIRRNPSPQYGPLKSHSGWLSGRMLKQRSGGSITQKQVVSYFKNFSAYNKMLPRGCGRD